MSASFKSIRGYWLPSRKNDGRFVVASSTSYNIEDGLDIPDLTPFISPGQPVYTHQMSIHANHGAIDEFLVFYTSETGARRANPSVHRLCGGAQWPGDFVVFRMRKGCETRALVNMRKHDDISALTAVAS